MTKLLKLEIELVPVTCWLSNVRSVVSKKQWDHIRDQTADKAWGLCQICGGVGPKHPVECHEIWHYDDDQLVQKLIGMIALCPACHQVKHFGFAQMQGKDEEALRHFMKVNKLSRKAAEKEINNSFDIWTSRSQKEWTLDVSLLENYSVDVSKITERK